MKNNQENSPYYHSELKGCKLIKRKIWPSKSSSATDKYRWLDGRYCLTHKTVCCRCGWQFGYHNGDSSAWLNKMFANSKRDYTVTPEMRIKLLNNLSKTPSWQK